ncbi:MAG: metal-dependent hydrolase [Methanomicrobiales archaeon]|nr:metal-dependent hydrolase [Methanomicrobiales archaeon]
MRGDRHVVLGVFSATLLLAPWLGTLDPGFCLSAVAGVFIGSLAPDADAADAAIFRGFSGGRGLFRRLIRHTVLVLPLVGYVIRYGIYYPVSALLWICTLGTIRPQHRGFLHSLPGAFATTGILLLYGALLFGHMGLSLPLHAIVFGAGFFAGAVLHLLADTCTRGGIAWGFPFVPLRLAGSFPGGSRDRRPEILAGLLGGGTVLFLVAAPLGMLPAAVAPAGAACYAAAIWALFLHDTGVHRV